MRLPIAALALAVPAAAQTGADSAAVRASALDYAEGWYEGSSERMARALHPELVKRIVVWDSTTKRSVPSGFSTCIGTPAGPGSRWPAGWITCSWPRWTVGG